MLQNTGPGWNSNVSRPRCQIVTPVMSDGSRSGVHCTRRHEQSMEAAMALARLVLPTPGTSSMRRWPSASMQISASSMASVLPWTDREMFVVMTSNRSGKVGAARSTTVTTHEG